MSVAYKAVGWNAFKKRYDLWLVVGVVLFLAAFVGVSLGLNPEATLEIMLIRATATAASTATATRTRSATTSTPATRARCSWAAMRWPSPPAASTASTWH